MSLQLCAKQVETLLKWRPQAHLEPVVDLDNVRTIQLLQDVHLVIDYLWLLGHELFWEAHMRKRAGGGIVSPASMKDAGRSADLPGRLFRGSLWMHLTATSCFVPSCFVHVACFTSPKLPSPATRPGSAGVAGTTARLCRSFLQSWARDTTRQRPPHLSSGGTCTPSSWHAEQSRTCLLFSCLVAVLSLSSPAHAHAGRLFRGGMHGVRSDQAAALRTGGQTDLLLYEVLQEAHG